MPQTNLKRPRSPKTNHAPPHVCPLSARRLVRQVPSPFWLRFFFLLIGLSSNDLLICVTRFTITVNKIFARLDPINAAITDIGRDMTNIL